MEAGWLHNPNAPGILANYAVHTVVHCKILNYNAVQIPAVQLSSVQCRVVQFSEDHFSAVQF